MKKTEQKVIKFIDENRLLESSDRVLVALSGGPDSVFLLHFLNKYKKKFNISIGAFHLNHKIRGKDAEKDQEFCSNLSDSFGIAYFSASEDISKIAASHKVSLEEAGRNVRYEKLTMIAAEKGFSKISTAHNANDNAETVLLNLIKGAGVKGLAGIPVSRGNIIRPILILTKNEILEYLEISNIAYRKDKSNKSNDYQRNYIRNRIIPLIKDRLNPGLEKTILSSSFIFRNYLTGIEKRSEKELSKFAEFREGILNLDLNKLEKIAEPYRSEYIKLLIERNFCKQSTFKDITKIISLLTKEAGSRVNLSEKITAARERDRIILYENVPESSFIPVKLQAGQKVEIDKRTLYINTGIKLPEKFPNKSYVEYISADDLEENFIIRRWQNGDKFRPLGLKGTKKVSDFLNDQKLSSSSRKKQLVLTNKGRIVWIVGLRIDDRFKITNTTKKVYQLCLI